MNQLDLSSRHLDFPIGSESNDRIRWSWKPPLGELWFDQLIGTELVANGLARTCPIYSQRAGECVASHWIEKLNGILKRPALKWTARNPDPGRVACLTILYDENPLEESDVWCSQLAFFKKSPVILPWDATNTWLYPDGEHWLLTVTTMISQFNFPDEEDSVALRLAEEAYHNNYRILYQKRISTQTLEQWREQARAFLRQVYSHLETPFEIP